MSADRTARIAALILIGLGLVCFLRRPTAAHRLEIDPVASGGETCWSLFITGPNVRTWGFWCPRGWKPWQKFVDMGNSGAVGPGCGEG